MEFDSVSVDQGTIRIQDLEIVNQGLADYFRQVRREELRATFVRAVEVGAFCLQRVATAQDLEFVRRQVDNLMSTVEASVAGIPEKIECALMTRIGTGEGQVLAPVQDLVAGSVKAVSDRLNELRVALKEIDPTKADSPAGRVVGTLRDLLDAKRTDSVQASLTAAVNVLVTSDGALAATVQKTVESALKPLREEVDRLAKEIHGQESAIEALAETTAKGVSFEDEIVTTLSFWARHTGVQVQHVGGDNRPGDIIVTVPVVGCDAIKIVIEAKDQRTPRGRKAITDSLATAMAERRSGCALYVTRKITGLANEIGEWAEGECELGPFVACTFEHLITAIRFVVTQRRLRALRSSHQELDRGSIAAQMIRMRTALERIKNINRKTTDIRSSANDIETEATSLRSEVRDALSAIEETIRQVARSAESAIAVHEPVAELTA